MVERCHIEQIGFLVLRTHLAPFIGPDDLLAVKLTSKQLHLVVKLQTFDVNAITEPHPATWWAWLYSEIKKVHQFGIDRLLGYMTARFMEPADFREFVLSPLFEEWVRDQDPDITSRMCNGAAICGNNQTLRIARGVAFNNWRSAACTAAKFNKLRVVQWLSSMNELTRGFCDDCASVDARQLGLTIGAYSGPTFLDWAIGISDDNEVNKPSVVIGLAMMGRHNELERVLEKYGDDIGFMKTMACETAVMYSEIETAEMLMQRGVPMGEGINRMIGAIPVGYTGMLMTDIREPPQPGTIVEWFKFYDYVHTDFSPVRADVLLNPFVLRWEQIPGNQDD
jgi:hypothetical protein